MSSSKPPVLRPSSYIVMHIGQATTNFSTPLPASVSSSASRMRSSLGLGSSSKSIQRPPPPPPQQKELLRLRGISSSSQPVALMSSRGASYSSLYRPR